MCKNHLFRIILISIAIIVLVTAGFSQEKEQIRVMKLQAETNNNLLVTVQIVKAKVVIGETIPVFITVYNNNNRPIFYVKKENPEITNNKGDITINSPIPFPEDKEEYDYSFHKIEPSDSYSGQFLIPGSMIQREDIIDIFVGMGFVYDITGINRRLKPGEDPMTLRGSLSKRIETVGVGILSITVYAR